MIPIQVKNRFKEVAVKIVEAMVKGENQGNFALDGDIQPLTTRERYDAVSEVENMTGLKVGLAQRHIMGEPINYYCWETI